MKNRIILTDCDGVLCDWAWAFDVWMKDRGFDKKPKGYTSYDIEHQYDVSREQGFELIEKFNKSSVIEFLPPFKDSINYVKKLHDRHGYVFHCITSIGTEKISKKRRIKNLHDLFGANAITEVVCLGTGADKTSALKEYENSKCWWIEDKWENCIVGEKLGLTPILVEHGHNLNFRHRSIPRVKNWKEIYQIITNN